MRKKSVHLSYTLAYDKGSIWVLLLPTTVYYAPISMIDALSKVYCQSTIETVPFRSFFHRATSLKKKKLELKFILLLLCSLQKFVSFVAATKITFQNCFLLLKLPEWRICKKPIVVVVVVVVVIVVVCHWNNQSCDKKLAEIKKWTWKEWKWWLW